MSAAAAETHASILSLPELVNNDAGLVRRGRYLTATFLVGAGDTEFLVRVVGAVRRAHVGAHRSAEPGRDPLGDALECDFSCTPEDTRLTAETIPGARFTVMTEIGHFPMAENPAQFRRYILSVLDEIRAAAG